MKRRHMVFISLLLIFMAGCNDSAARIDGLTFAEIEKEARGTTVFFYMWGGDARINSWVDGYLSGALLETYDIVLRRVPEDASVFVNRLLAERQANRNTGSIDLVWINGENFKNAKEANLIYGPVTQLMPNFQKYIDASTVTHDFGFPVEGFEIPYGRAQFVFEHDTRVLPDPPRSFAELEEWVIHNPGRFTYPQPPSFTGSAFIRQALYAVTGGHEQYMAGFNEALYRRKSPLLWQYLNRLEPFLWEQGRTYPKEKAALDTLFVRGEIDINMSYHQADAQGRILNGQYRNSVRTFLMNEGSLYNTHFTAIPFNAPNKAGAIAVGNFLLDPDVQLTKNDPSSWGDFTVLDLQKLSPADRFRFEDLDLGDATLDLRELEIAAVPEIPSEYLEVLESDWEEHVLRN